MLDQSLGRRCPSSTKKTPATWVSRASRAKGPVDEAPTDTKGRPTPPRPSDASQHSGHDLPPRLDEDRAACAGGDRRHQTQPRRGPRCARGGLRARPQSAARPGWRTARPAQSPASTVVRPLQRTHEGQSRAPTLDHGLRRRPHPERARHEIATDWRAAYKKWINSKGER